MFKKKAVWVVALFLFCSLGAYLVIRIVTHPAEKETRTIDDTFDSLNLHYVLFDKDNRKSLEVWARESQKGKNDKLFLKGVRAVIYKKGRMTEDIQVEADEGNTTPNFLEFEIRKNACIHSPRLMLLGERFILYNMDLLRARQPVQYRLDEITGTAAKGLDFYFKPKDLWILNAEGRFMVSGQEYQHKQERGAFLHEKNLIGLDKVEYLKTSDTVSHADRYQIDLTEDGKYIRFSIAIKNSYLFRQKLNAKGISEALEIHADIIETFFDSLGRAERSRIRGGWGQPEGSVVLMRGNTRTEIIGPNYLLTFVPETGQLLQIDGETCWVNHRGSERFRFFSQKPTLKMDEGGELKIVYGIFDCRLEWGKNKAKSHEMLFQKDKSLFTIKGAPARIQREESIFDSPVFFIDTRNRQIFSDADVRAVLAPPANSQSGFFKKSAFVVSKKMIVDERKNRLLFLQEVKLVQEGMEARGDQLLVETQRDRQTAQIEGGAVCEFHGDRESFSLAGGIVRFSSAERGIEAGPDARLTAGDRKLEAERISIQFGPGDEIEKIVAWNRVRAHASELEGSSEYLEWDYRGGMALFRKSAKIVQKGVTTIDEEIRVNMNKNEIVGRPRDQERLTDK